MAGAEGLSPAGRGTPQAGRSVPAGRPHVAGPDTLGARDTAGHTGSGARRHIRIATISAQRDAAVHALRRTTPDVADWVEVRLDTLWPAPPEPDSATDDLVALLDAAQVPLLATLRPVRQAGAYDGPEDVRRNLLGAAVQAGFAAVDLEDDDPGIGAAVRALRDLGAEVVLSDHRFQETPAKDVAMRHLQSMQDLHGRLDKIAFPVQQFMDGLRALELAHSHAHRNGRPAIAPLGGDAMLRALLPLAGNHATYGHAPGTAPAVPGQPELIQIDALWRHWGIRAADLPGDPEHGWFAVIGDPVEHSLSPRIHNAMLRHAGVPQRFGALTVPDAIGAMRLVVTIAHRIGLRGCSVTMPLKHHAQAVTAPDAVARAVGAANCIRFGASARSTNTDATAMRRLLGGHASVAVLGAGGAARAALWAAADLGIEATFASRDAERAREVRDATGAHWLPWDQREQMAAEAWVQATPLHGPVPPVDVAPGASTAIELVYADGATAFETIARDAGARVIDGRRFLVEQACDAYRFWTGDEADAAVMQEALA